jgi:hypothetical protein
MALVKGLVLFIGLWMIVSGGFCAVMDGFNGFALIDLGIAIFGGWMIWVVFIYSPPAKATNDPSAHKPAQSLPPEEHP